MTDELNLAIPIKSIYDEFLCPICYDLIKECAMTHCSHNFCKECITECLNRKKKCPCCNTLTTPQQLTLNKQFDRLIAMIQLEKQKASKIYFSRLISDEQSDSSNNSTITATTTTTTTTTTTPAFSPIELVFHTHLKKSLAGYEEYYQKIKSKYDILADEIKQKYTDLMTEHQKNRTSLDITTQDEAILNWRRECEEFLQQNQQNFQKSIENLLASYEHYISACIPPAPQFIPVMVTVQVPSKCIQFPNVLLNPMDTPFEIRNIIAQKMEKKGDQVVGFDKETNLLKLINVGVNPDNGIVIADDRTPIMSLQPDHGALLVLLGDLKCKSDVPKECFKNSFMKGAKMVMDYYTCKDCKLNWVCKSCAETCHIGHNINEYIHGHAPTWACCYCYKNICSLTKKT